MKRTPLSCWLAALSVLALVSHTASADDITPPFYRGDPNTVMAKFDLFGAPAPGGPTQLTFGANPTYPLSTATASVSGAMTNPTLPNAIDYTFVVPNYIDLEPLKLVRVQYSWFGGIPGPTGDAFTSLVVPVPGGTAQLVNSSPVTNVTGNIYHRYDDFEIRPNPDFEEFVITFVDADPRWVIFDTISFPEPASAALLGLGALALLRRRS